MTVAEYIKHLQRFPKDMEIFRYTENRNYDGEPIWVSDAHPVVHKCHIDGELKEFVAI